jgi:hypothetical protein
MFALLAVSGPHVVTHLLPWSPSAKRVPTQRQPVPKHSPHVLATAQTSAVDFAGTDAVGFAGALAHSSPQLRVASSTQAPSHLKLQQKESSSHTHCCVFRSARHPEGY